MQCWRPRFNPWVGNIPWRRKWQPTPVFLPGEFHGQRSLEGCSSWGWKKSVQEWVTIIPSLRRLRWGHKGGILMMGLIPLCEVWRELEPTLHTMCRCSQKVAVCKARKSSHQILTLLASWSWTSQAPELWEITVCHLNHPVYDIWL